MVSGTVLEKPAKEGESPVDENHGTLFSILSTTEHVKFCGNPGGPPPKAKYSPVTDSELVP